MARVTLENIRKVYENGFVAVHGASFVAHDGEFVVLVTVLSGVVPLLISKV